MRFGSGLEAELPRVAFNELAECLEGREDLRGTALAMIEAVREKVDNSGVKACGCLEFGDVTIVLTATVQQMITVLLFCRF